MSDTRSDEDSKYESEEEITINVMAFAGKCKFDSESSYEDISDKELVET